MTTCGSILTIVLLLNAGGTAPEDVVQGLKSARDTALRGTATWTMHVSPQNVPAGLDLAGAVERRSVSWDGLRRRVETETISIDNGVSLERVGQKHRIWINTPTIDMWQWKDRIPTTPPQEHVTINLYARAASDPFLGGPGIEAGRLHRNLPLSGLSIESENGQQVVCSVPAGAGRTLRFACARDRGYTLDWFECHENGTLSERYTFDGYRQVNGTWWPGSVERDGYWADGTLSGKHTSTLVDASISAEPLADSLFELTINEQTTVLDHRHVPPTDQEAIVANVPEPEAS